MTAGMLAACLLTSCNARSVEANVVHRNEPTGTDTVTMALGAAPPVVLAHAGDPPAPVAAAALSQSAAGAAAVARCRTDQLRLDARPVAGAAAVGYLDVVLTNLGAVCVTQGYPGVSFLDDGRRQVGPAASWHPGGRPAELTLGPGQSTAALVALHSAGCADATRSAYLRVFPPGETDAAVTPLGVAVCQPEVGALALAPAPQARNETVPTPLPSTAAETRKICQCSRLDLARDPS